MIKLPVYVYIAVGYLVISLLGLFIVELIRLGQKRNGPFTSPKGNTFYVIWNDRLASMLNGSNQSCTTIIRTVGVNKNYTKAGPIDDWMIAHEVGIHVEKQWTILGKVSELLFLPLYFAFAWLGTSSPFEVPGYAYGQKIALESNSNPERAGWEKSAQQVNATHP